MEQGMLLSIAYSLKCQDEIVAEYIVTPNPDRSCEPINR